MYEAASVLLWPSWFYYSISPIGYHLDVQCLVSQLPVVGNP